MKALFILLTVWGLALVLTACGGGETVTGADIAITQPAVIVVNQPEPEPAKPLPTTVVCDLNTYVPCSTGQAPTPEPVACNPKDAGCVVPEGMEYCDMWSYAPCQSPIWIKK